MKSICLDLFSAVLTSFQAWDSKVHVRIKSGEQPFPSANNIKLPALIRSCSTAACPSSLSSSTIPKQYRLATLTKLFTFKKLSPIKLNTSKNLYKATLSVKTLAIINASNKFKWLPQKQMMLSFLWFP